MTKSSWLVCSVKEKVNRNRKMEKGTVLCVSRRGPQTEEQEEMRASERSAPGTQGAETTPLRTGAVINTAFTDFNSAKKKLKFTEDSTVSK